MSKPTSAGPQSYQKANENLGLENGLPLRKRLEWRRPMTVSRRRSIWFLLGSLLRLELFCPGTVPGTNDRLLNPQNALVGAYVGECERKNKI